ncbi:hypothetical protein [Brevibacterium renqingii]|uniref:hypothetical protein n=1 Tax=Brevibacterium renqingii TaxID=2776916 RepID=UPI001ADF6678|nr:hypothetical protein [Brevibacterium renqingii]
MSAAIEQRAREEAETLPLESLAVELRARLGVLLVAYIAGAHGTESVNQWVLGMQKPSPLAIERLRLAHNGIASSRDLQLSPELKHMAGTNLGPLKSRCLLAILHRNLEGGMALSP